MALTHDALEAIKQSRSIGDLEALIAHAEETLGKSPVKENILDEEGNLIETVEHAHDAVPTSEVKGS